ncbi:MAG: tetratricopeptide repeat protein, partial [Parafilimonas sp.]|nr:tetratricopeptide repeat protein [Parafilimonas sp.]
MKLLLLSVILCITGCCSVQAQTDSLLSELNKHPQQDTVRFFLLKKLAFQYSLTDPSKGVEAANAAIELAEKLNDPVKIAGAYSNKATNFHKLGRDSQALALYRIAANMHLNAGYKKGAANVYFNMAYVYFDIGNYIMSINYESQALALYKSLDLVADEADTYNNIGNNYMRLDDYSSALKNFFKALNTYQQLGDKENGALVLSNIGMTYHELCDSAKALDYYQKALALNMQTGNKKNLAHDYQHIGVLHDDANRFTEALNYYMLSLNLNKEINDKREMAANMVNIATVYSKLNNFSAAYKNINDALKIYKVLRDDYNTAALLNEKGKIYVDCPTSFLEDQNIQYTQRYTTALSYQQQALQLSQKINSHSLSAQILEDISNTYAKSDKFSNALNAYKQAVELRDTIFNDDQKKQITKLEMQFEFDKKEAATKALNDKKEALASQEISKQKSIKNLIILSGAALLFAAIVSFVLYKKRKDAIEQKKEADFKTQVVETEMKALRAQMNPHFIFNSLNSIADYIQKNETQTASDFTVKFSKLMRMVLENSERAQIPLANDLKALELYIQLERFRLKNKFDYKIVVDENIDRENTLVPPLILQPFVENSIWHGIAKKEGHGTIMISIQKQNEMISCIVEDDGAGISV